MSANKTNLPYTPWVPLVPQHLSPWQKFSMELSTTQIPVSSLSTYFSAHSNTIPPSLLSPMPLTKTALLPVSACPFLSPSENTAVLQPQQHQTIPQCWRLTLLSLQARRCWKLPCSIPGSLVILLLSQAPLSLPKDPVAISAPITFQF